MTSRGHISCGRDLHCCYDINNSLGSTCRAGFDFICMPLVHPRFKRESSDGPAKNRKGPFTRSDMLLTSQDWGSLVVGKTSPWLQLESVHDALRKNSERAFKQELLFSSHLSVPAVLIEVKGPKSVNLARILSEHVQSGQTNQFWMHVPMLAPSSQLEDIIDVKQGGEFSDKGDSEKTIDEENDTWKWWSDVKILCDSHKKIGLALEVSADLPTDDAVDRWMGEPIKAAILPTSIFLTNRKGFPVLSRAHQELMKKLFKLDVQVILSGADLHSDKGLQCYQQYLEHIWRNQDPVDNVTHFAKGYEDYLQCPLQPLMDNLESQTYEVFEKDPVKYSQYQLAVYEALMDLIPDEEKDTRTLTLMVLGAGRGPLVSASLNAASKANRKIQVYAVEKNPNAVVTLENLKEEQWGNKVTVVSSDMRVWEAPEKADIIVSELLGSFGDNELSPECLDGAQKFLKEGGISIPWKYTSFVAPLSSSKLWNEARHCKETGKPPEAPFETPYVVRLHNIFKLSETKPLFTFHHPNKGVIDNSRYGHLTFDVTQSVILHGFGGYFDCQLYKEINLSIVPETHSPGMFSWFPIYFPIKEPIAVNAGEKLTVHFWRVVTEKNVWYEWCISEPHMQPIHNPKGRSYTIGL